MAVCMSTSVGSRGTIQLRLVLYGPLDPTLCTLILIQHSCPCFNYHIILNHASYNHGSYITATGQDDTMQLGADNPCRNISSKQPPFYPWHAHVRTWGYLAIFSNVDVYTVTMGVACPLLRRSIYAPVNI